MVAVKVSGQAGMEVRRGQIGPSGPGPSEVWIQRSLDEGTERVMREENSDWSCVVRLHDMELIT